MPDRQNYTMTQADYDQIVERIGAARSVSGMFLSGGRPMGDVQEAANSAWRELGRRMGFDGMSVQPGASKLQFSAMPVTQAAESDTVAEAAAGNQGPPDYRFIASMLLEALKPFARFADSMDQLGHDAEVKHLIRKLTPDDFRKAREAIALAQSPASRDQLQASVEESR